MKKLRTEQQHSQESMLSNITTTIVNNKTATYAFYTFEAIPEVERLIDGE